MDLAQRRLTKFEWESIEMPESEKEMKILKMICNGYHDLNIHHNQTTSILSFLKMDVSLLNAEYLNCINVYIYNTYLTKKIDEIVKTFSKKGFVFKIPEPKTKMKIKKADMIRFNSTKQLNSDIFEFLLLDEIAHFYKNKSFHYFTLFKLFQNNIKNLNSFVFDIVSYFLQTFETEVSFKEIVYNCNEYIEKNEILTKYSDVALYDHQKQLFFSIQTPNPKLIFYIAPTGTGKTLSPIAISNKFKVIFVCAARHVGLSFARACISMGKKIAFAFGCQTADDIRLHYFAAKDYVKDRRSGGIYKVDNSVGDKVEIIISDLQSYLSSMHYMIAFNSPDDILLYWDEPTISLDYPDHPLHAVIKKNWSENLIPNIILSSATLPRPDEIGNTIDDYVTKFNGDVLTVESYHCRKTIPLYDNVGSVVLPHLITTDYHQMKDIVNNCFQHLTMLRYFELTEVTNFIQYAIANNVVSQQYILERYFTCLDEITTKNIKMYYLNILREITEDLWSIGGWETRPKMEGEYATLITTKDSYTLTDGPTIFLTENVEKIAKFCIQQAEIPQKTMDDIMKLIEINNDVQEKIVILEKRKEDLQTRGEPREQTKSEDLENSKQVNIKKDNENAKGVPAINRELAMLQQLIKPVFLNNIFIPNKLEHAKKWAPTANPGFTSDIDELTIIRIMTLEVDYSWKVLLLIGVGVFSTQTNADYTEIMKQLASEQKLFLIIAHSDFIYGTNYQFCHGYLSKDLAMTQDKTMQAMGRIGRNGTNSTYSVRFRKIEQIHTLFYSAQDKPEVINMNRLFC